MCRKKQTEFNRKIIFATVQQIWKLKLIINYCLCFIKWNRCLIQIGFPFIIVLFLASHTRPPSFLQQSLSSLTTCPADCSRPVLSHSTESCGGPITLHNYCAFPTVIGASSSGTKGAVRFTSDARHASERFVRSSSVVYTVVSSISPW